MKKEFRITMEKYGFAQNATNYVKHEDGVLQMCHNFSFDGDIRLFFLSHGCEITFYDGAVFEEKFLKYIIGKWGAVKDMLITRWDTKYLKNKKYITQNPQYYLLQGEQFAKKSDEKEKFSPVIFPILSFYENKVQWKMTDEDFNKIGFEYSSKEEKARRFIHTSRNLTLVFSSVNTFIFDGDNKKHIDIDRRVSYKCKTLEVLRMLDLLNH